MNSTDSTIMEQLYDGNWIHYRPLHILKDNTITEPLQNSSGGVQWYTDERKCCAYTSSAVLNLFGIVDIVKRSSSVL